MAITSDDTFRFYLRPDLTTYYNVSGGNVSVTTTKTRINSCISDWENIKIALKRSPTYRGLLREYSTPAKFVSDGARILKYLLYNNSFTVKVTLLIEKLNPDTRLYETWYQGDVTYQGMGETSDSFEVSIKERGLVGLLKAREDTEYEIPLTGSGVVTGLLDGVKLGAKSSWVLGDGSENSTDYPYTPHTGSLLIGASAGDIFIGRAIPTTSIGSDVQAGSFIVPRDQLLSGNVTNPDTAGFTAAVTTAKATAAWYNGRVTGLFRMKVNLEAGSVSGTPTYRAILKAGVMTGITLSAPNGTRDTTKTITLGISGVFADFVDTTINFNIDTTLPTIPADSAWFIYVDYQLVTGTFSGMTKKEWFYSDNSTLTINYQAQVAASNYKAFRYIDFLKKFVSKMTDGQYTADSYYLSNNDTTLAYRAKNFDNSAFNTLITCGDALRGLPNAKLKTTLKDINQDLWSKYGLCMVIENNVVRFETWDYCFSQDIVMTLETTGKPTVKLWEEKIFNNIEVGYNSYDNDNVAGKNEFNTTLKFLIKDNDQILKTEDSKSTIRADIYGIESVRAQTLDETKKDNKSDNDLFAIEVNPIPMSNGVYRLWRPYGATITGVDDPAGVYNVALSPMRCYLRKWAIYRSLVNTGIAQYQTIDKNSELVSNLGSGMIVETADRDLTANTMNGQDVSIKFLPFIISIKAEAPFNSIEMLTSQPRGLIRFKDNGNYYLGWPMDAGCTPGDNDAYEYELLAHPSNIMDNLNTYE